MFWYSVFYGQNKKGKEKKKNGKKNWDLNPGFLSKTFPPKIYILSDIRSIEMTVLKKSRLYFDLLERKSISYWFNWSLMHICTKFFWTKSGSSSSIFLLKIWFKNLDCMLLFLKLYWLESWLENLQKYKITL